MEKKETLLIIQNIFCDVLDDEDITLTLETTADDIDDWDSMSHLNLVMALGEEFEITLEFEEIMSIQTINDVFSIVENKLKSNETTN